MQRRRKMCFTGQDGSMGLTKSRVYQVSQVPGDAILLGRYGPFAIQLRVEGGPVIPYESLHALLDNWQDADRL